jgi:hypothetical protein
MSHFTEVKVQLSDREALIEAIQATGLVYEDHETPQKLNGMYGQDFSAHVIIRKNRIGSYSDFGVLFGEGDTSTTYCDDMDFKIKPEGNYVQNIIKNYHMVLLKRAGVDVENARVETGEEGRIIVTVGGGGDSRSDRAER